MLPVWPREVVLEVSEAAFNNKWDGLDAAWRLQELGSGAWVATSTTSRGAPFSVDLVFRVVVTCPLYTTSRLVILSAVCMPHMCQTLCSGHERVYTMSVYHMQVIGTVATLPVRSGRAAQNPFMYT